MASPAVSTAQPTRWWVVRTGWMSRRVPRRLVAWLVVTLLVLLAVSTASLVAGDYPLPVADIPRILTGGGTPLEQKIIVELRFARIAAGIVVGAALGLAGALTQSVARNPLASPDVLGITQGAALAAVMVIAGDGVVGILTDNAVLARLGVSAAALVGATATAAAIWWLAAPQRRNPVAVLLIGVGVGMLLQAITTWLIAATDLERAAAAHVWLSGSLAGARGDNLLLPGIVLVAALGLSGVLAFQLSALSLGEVTASMLGVKVTVVHALQLSVAVALTAAAVSTAGPIGFVAFASPHIARLLTKVSTPPLVTSSVVGATVVVAADYVSRVLLPVELPVGIITIVCGAPILVVTIITLNRGKKL